jgi:hypothetical protein
MFNNSPLHPFWYLKYSVVFSLVLILEIIKGLNPEAIFSTIVLIILIVVFYLVGKIFIFRIEGNNLIVRNGLDKIQMIPMVDVEKIYIRQGVIGKILGLKGLFIQVPDQYLRKGNPVKVFGLPINLSGLQFPGIWGNLICIPDISIINTDAIIHDIKNNSGREVEVINLGVGLPWYNGLTKISYLFGVIIVLFLIFMLVLTFVVKFI